MQLIQQHHTEGPGLIKVKSPDLAVRILIDPDATHRSVHILADRGLAAFSGPFGPGGSGMNIEVGRPSMAGFLLDTLGLRSGSSVSGGGSASSAGRGAVAAGGDITECVTGDNARISTRKEDVRRPGPGVHITAPLGCDIKIKAAPSVLVLWCGVEHTLESAHRLGVLKKV